MTTTTYYAIGREHDPAWIVGFLDGDGTFWWVMNREKFEAVVSGQSGQHCDTCTCEQSADGSVIGDDNGTRYTRTQFAVAVLCQITAEDRSLVKA